MLSVIASLVTYPSLVTAVAAAPAAPPETALPSRWERSRDGLIIIVPLLLIIIGVVLWNARGNRAAISGHHAPHHPHPKQPPTPPTPLG